MLSELVQITIRDWNIGINTFSVIAALFLQVGKRLNQTFGTFRGVDALKLVCNPRNEKAGDPKMLLIIYWAKQPRIIFLELSNSMDNSYINLNRKLLRRLGGLQQSIYGLWVRCIMTEMQVRGRNHVACESLLKLCKDILGVDTGVKINTI